MNFGGYLLAGKKKKGKETGTGIKSFRELIVWQKAHVCVLDVYKLTKIFPSEEKFGLVSQMRRAAVSVPANIAEGFKRRTKNNKISFYNISQSSLEELRYYLILSKDLDYIKDCRQLELRCQEVAMMLDALMEAVAKKTS